MRKQQFNVALSVILTVGMLLAFAFCATSRAAEPPRNAPERTTREIYVPFSDLHILLEQQPKRVLLGRGEYDDLLRKAKKTPETHAPRPAVILAADYTIAVAAQRAELRGVLAIDVLEDGLHALLLDLGGVALQSATLDRRSAPIGLADGGRLKLFVEGVGRHTLVLEMVAPLEANAAQQVLNFHLPRPAAARMRLTAPGDVDIKSGADVVSRVVDDVAHVTRFEILPREGDTSLLMTLNSHLKRRQQAVVARSVLIDEVTQAYEQLHATVSLDVLYQAVDRFRFTVPEGFEILEVTSPLLARWEVQSDDGRKILNVRLREQTIETIVLNLSAIKTPGPTEGWKAPRLEPLDVVGQMGVVGLLVEDRLQIESMLAEGLIPINTTILSQAMPRSVELAAPGMPSLRAVAAWYAPQGQFGISARFKKSPAEMAATTSLLLIVGDQGQEVLGGVSLLPQLEKAFAFDLTAPAGWRLTSMTAADEKPLPFEYHARPEEGAAAEATRIRVNVPGGMAAGEEFKVNFRAVYTPPNWLADWQSTPVEFPVFSVADATREEGAVAIDVRDDLTVRPEKLDQLIPLDAAEKSKYGLKDVPSTLAYRYDRPKYAASLVVERTKPRLTARTFSFLRVDSDGLNCHYELIYDVAEARAQRLALKLPKNTPLSLSIQARDGVKLKDFGSEVRGGHRVWNALLAEPRRGKVRLAVDFRQPFPSEEPKGFELPIVAAEGVEYQSGLMAVEGCAELETQVDTAARRVDVGELADAEYQPGRRLLGAYGFSGDMPSVTIDARRHPDYPVYPAIVQCCELDTNISPEGESQTQAYFRIHAKAIYVEVKLPAGADFWSAELDGVPLKPQREGNSVLIGLPAGLEHKSQVLQITYRAPVRAVALRGTVEVPAPKLLFRAGRDVEAVEVPLASVLWRLHLPSGYEAVSTGGTLVADGLDRPLPVVLHIGEALYRLSHDIADTSPMYHRMASSSPPPASAMSGLGYSAGAPPKIAHRTDGQGRGNENWYEQNPGGFMGIVDWSQIELDHEAGPSLRETAVDAVSRVASSMTAARPKAPSYAPTPKLLGTRSLKIDVVQSPAGTDPSITFHSLGGEPRLVVTLANQPRFVMLGWGLAMAIALWGVTITRRATRKKAAFVLTILLATTFAPVLFDSVEFVQLCNRVFFTACLLAPYYLVVGVAMWLVRRIWQGIKRMPKSVSEPAIPFTPAAILLALLLAGDARADPPAAKPDAPAGAYVIQVVEPSPPVNVPTDAIILPYDPDSEAGIKNVDRLLVPYEKYVELWNRAYPDKKIDARPAPAPYALAGASYKTLLEGDEYVLLSGQMEIDVFSDGFVQIPLGLGGGVLAQAELDGKPARLSVAGVADRAANATNQPAAQQQAAAPQKSQKAADQALRNDDRSVIVLHILGKGRHKLDLAVRLKLSRQGGWRVVKGVLPAAPATALAITLPQPRTELRLGQVADRRSYETEKPDETINTALGLDGALNLQWRPKVSEGQVDHSLTAASDATLDVQEDGLRIVWRLGLEFRRSQREQFSVNVPKDYLVEKVDGGNVRGWETRKTDQGQTVEIALLKPAKDHETFTLRLWRKGLSANDGLAEFDVPVIGVADAALHNGQLTIRRSPLLEVRTLDHSGLVRTDLPAAADQSAGVESPLGIRPFEAYRFAATPFVLRLAASPAPTEVSAVVQSIVRFGESERSLESRMALDVKGRPLYQIAMFLPEELRLDHVSAPGEFQYAVTRQNDRALLTIYLANGQTGSVPVLLRGKLTRGTATEQSLPRLEILNVRRQQGDVAVQVDPAFDVDAVGLTHCDRIDLLSKLASWLNAEQQRVTRLGIHYDRGDYAAMLRLSPRAPDVTCDTITNLRVTDRSVETTILLDFAIRNAGIRSVSFFLPEEMAGCRVHVPMLRQKKIEKVPGKSGQTFLRVSLDLQDEVMDQLRVLVEDDRLLAPGSQEVPIPSVDLGRINHRYVTIEREGRDEVVIEDDSRRGIDILGRQQKEWEQLKGILGREMTLAYLVASDAQEPHLAFHVMTGTAVQTVDARIGLAKTTLVCDDNGTYRAEQVFRVDNSTEPFLDIQLPDGAALWTIRVAGESIKPTKPPQVTDLRNVRIPLLKTAPGDLDYEVVLKYGGNMPSFGAVGKIEFPLVRCMNIKPESSQVKLYMPENRRCFAFSDTMRLVESEADLLAGYIGYQTRQTERIVQTLQQGDTFAKARAATNLKKQQWLMSQYQGMSGAGQANPRLQTELKANYGLMQQAQQEAAAQEQASDQGQLLDNRQQLGKVFWSQSGGRARNVINEMETNWKDADQTAPPAQPAPAQQFNDQWLGANKLATTTAAATPAVQEEEEAAIPSKETPRRLSKKSGDKRQRDEVQTRIAGRKDDAAKKPSAAEVVQGKAKRELAESSDQQQIVTDDRSRAGGEDREALGRYKQRLEDNANKQVGPAGAGSFAARQLVPQSDVPAATQPSSKPEDFQWPAEQTMTGRVQLGVGVNSDAGLSGTIRLDVAEPESGDKSVSAQATAVSSSAGLASLDFELVPRGVVYRFTTPRGEQRIIAWTVSNNLLRRLIAFAALFAVVVVVWLAVKLVRVIRFSRLAGRAASGQCHRG